MRRQDRIVMASARHASGAIFPRLVSNPRPDRHGGHHHQPLPVDLWRWNDPSPAGGTGSRLKVSRCQKTAIHVERDGRVLKGDLPGTIDTSQAYCYALPPLYTLTVGFGPGAYLIKAVTEGEVAACDNGQVATLLIDRAIPSVEPGRKARQIYPVCQWRRQIENDGIRRELRSDCCRVLIMKSLAYGVEDGFDCCPFGINGHDRLHWIKSLQRTWKRYWIRHC